jgi:hypothetical protein
LNAIDRELSNKGMTKSENPDLLINILLKNEKNRCQSIQYGLGIRLGLGLESFLWGGQNTFTTSSTEGTLFIDLIDAKKKNWFGKRRYRYLKIGEIKKNESMNLLQRF